MLNFFESYIMKLPDETHNMSSHRSFKHSRIHVIILSGNNFPIDIYGQGPHQNEIQEYATQYNLPATFLGVKDHSELIEYKVFVNPSVSEVLCTTIVEVNITLYV